MKRAVPLLLALCACSLRTPRVESAPCSSTAQCDRPAVCFLGECRGHSAALTMVSAEIRPANDSPMGVKQVAGIDLHLSAVQDFALMPPVAVSGSVTQEPDALGTPSPVPNALITFTDAAPAIADRVQQISTLSQSTGGFSTPLAQGQWDILVQPQAPLPPYRAPLPLQTSSPALQIALPRVSSLTQFQAALTADGGVLAGADVTAVDSSGNALSAPASVQLDGGFSLYLPPATSSYFLQVGPPPPELDGGSAVPALDPLPNYDHLSPDAGVDVPLTAVAALHGMVVDAVGAPVAGARVYARSDGMPWSLSRSVTTAADGTYSLSLRAGNYLVEAAPVAAQYGPAVSGEQAVIVPASGNVLNLRCPAKVHGYGLIARADGTNVSLNYQVTATRLADHLLTARIAWTQPTNTTGIWSIVADPGRYRLEVVPPADTGLPRKVVQVEIDSPPTDVDVQLPLILLSPPLIVGGTVHGTPPGGSDQPVANATVSFYALDAAGHSILLGSAPTDAKGQYKAVLPDVAQPAVALGGP